MENGNVYKKLMVIQQKLKAPKNQYNSFGKYKYRSCEDILEAVKPLLAEQKVVLTLSDTVELVGDRFYIKATACLIDTETGHKIENTAFAREDESKKGMDGSQVSGTSSTYARKYCLNGLFCIDDTKDADTDEFNRQEQAQPQRPAPAQQKVIRTPQDAYDFCKQHSITPESFCKYYGIHNVQEMTEDRFVHINQNTNFVINQLGGKI